MAHQGSNVGSPRQMIYCSGRMRQVDDALTRAAQSGDCVLLQGETGTGKEVAARQLWARSPRSGHSLVVLNAAAVPKEMVESELFGIAPHVATGVHAKVGLLYAAHKGTLFLDEIGDTPMEMQAKLLRILQEPSFRRVGAINEETVDVRFVCATNKNLEAEIRAGRFREDLFYRIAVHVIVLPPLRERPEDIPLLARYFCQVFAGGQQRISAEAERALESRPWPGNVRQLESAIKAALARCDGPVVEPHHLPDPSPTAAAAAPSTIEPPPRTRPPLASKLHYDRVQRPRLISQVLAQLLQGGRVATLLETHRGGGKTLARQLIRHCNGMPVVWLKDYTSENTSSAAFYGFLTASDSVTNQTEFGRWLSSQANQRGLLIVLFGIQGHEELLEEVAATVRSFLADHNRAAFLIVGGRRLLNLRKQERYSWLRLLPPSSFFDVLDLSEEEVGELLQLHQKPALLAPMFHAATGGHPWLLHELLCKNATEPEPMTDLIKYQLSMTGKLAAHLKDPKALAVLQRLANGQAVYSLANPCIRHEPTLYAESRLYFDGFVCWDKEGRTGLRCPAVRSLLEETLGG